MAIADLTSLPAAAVSDAVRLGVPGQHGSRGLGPAAVIISSRLAAVSLVAASAACKYKSASWARYTGCWGSVYTLSSPGLVPCSSCNNLCGAALCFFMQLDLAGAAKVSESFWTLGARPKLQDGDQPVRADLAQVEYAVQHQDETADGQVLVD